MRRFLAFARGRLVAGWCETRRLWWLVALLVATGWLLESGVFHPLSKWALVAFVLAKGTAAAIVWHLWRSQMFHYLDLKTALESRDPGYAIAAAIVIGLTGAAFILGVLVAV